jgi:hypothetical protein
VFRSCEIELSETAYGFSCVSILYPPKLERGLVIIFLHGESLGFDTFHGEICTVAHPDIAVYFYYDHTLLREVRRPLWETDFQSFLEWENLLRRHFYAERDLYNTLRNALALEQELLGADPTNYTDAQVLASEKLDRLERKIALQGLKITEIRRDMKAITVAARYRGGF